MQNVKLKKSSAFGGFHNFNFSVLVFEFFSSAAFDYFSILDEAVFRQEKSSEDQSSA
jgi:hypothetical protein